IMVPIRRVIAIYARENGQGMAFPLAAPAAQGPQAGVDAAVPAAPPLSPANKADTEPAAVAGAEAKIVQLVSANPAGAGEEDDDSTPPDSPKPPQGKRPSLKRVK